MSKRAPPPPTSAAPISQDVVAIVKKKLAAPKGPPPAGLAAFKPKAAAPPAEPAPQARRDSRDEDNDSYYNDDNRSYQYDSDGSEDSRDREDRAREDERMRELERAEQDGAPSPPDSPTQAYSSASAAAAPATIFGGVLAASKAAAKADAPPAKDKAGKPLTLSQGQATTLIPGSLLPQRVDRSIKPVIFNFAPVLKVTYRELRQFVLSPAPQGVIVRCYIERDRSGTNMFSPVYSLCADLEDGTGRELLACRKVMQSRTSHYIFSLKSEDLWRKREQRSRLYLGKLRAMSSNEYVLYDNGSMGFPEGLKEREDPPAGEGKTSEDTLYRKELAVIWFNTKSRPSPAGVRGTEVSIPGSFLSNDQIAIASNTQAATSGGTVVSRVADAKLSSSSSPDSVGSLGGLHSSRDLRTPFGRIRSAGKQNSWQPKTCFVLHERTSRLVPTPFICPFLIPYSHNLHPLSPRHISNTDTIHCRLVWSTSRAAQTWPASRTASSSSLGPKTTLVPRRQGQTRTRTISSSSAKPRTTALTWTSPTRSPSSKPLPSVSQGSTRSLAGERAGPREYRRSKLSLSETFTYPSSIRPLPCTKMRPACFKMMPPSPH